MKASELAKLIGAELIGDDCDVASISSIENITVGSLVPLLDRKIADEVFESGAGVYLAKTGFDTSKGGTYLLAEDAEMALVAAVNALYPPKVELAGVHKSAFVAESASIGKEASVGAQVYVGENAKIGEKTKVYPGAYIGDDVTIGKDCIIYANVSIYDGCTIGDRVIIHSGTVVGADGFGYYQRKGENIKIPHIGSVVLEDDVEIGANSCVDRGKFDNTIVGAGTKIDNQVQVAHNVKLGKNCILVGQAAISGSCELGDNVMVGARAGLADHVKICSRTMLAAGCGVMSNIDKPGIYGGLPHNTRKSWMREVALIRQLPEIVNRIAELEKKNA